jgi:hypothetical protein
VARDNRPRAKGEAAILAVPNCSSQATSASFGRFGLQAWGYWKRPVDPRRVRQMRTFRALCFA